MDMDRRTALQALAGLASAAGLTVTPVTASEARDAALIVLRAKGPVSADTLKRLHETWTAAVTGTPLQDVRAIVLDGDIDLQIVRTGGAFRLLDFNTDALDAAT